MDEREILRYLNARPGDPELEGMIRDAAARVTAAARPRWVHRAFPLEVAQNAVILGGHTISSRSLAGHLRGCREGVLLGVTLGAEIDRLIRRAELVDMALAPVLQAAAAAYTEEQADLAQEEIQADASRRGLYLRPRYSPGFGDFSLEEQRFFFAALEIPKRLGVTLTDGCMMVPAKSVTAVIGLSPDPSLCHVGKCMTCTLENCPFRKEEAP